MLKDLQLKVSSRIPANRIEWILKTKEERENGVLETCYCIGNLKLWAAG